MDTIKFIDFFLKLDISTYFKKNNYTIIDPIGCILNIILLQYYPSNTKLSIQKNMVDIQEPSVSQSFIRWSNGDSRNDLTILFNNIMLFKDIYTGINHFDTLLSKSLIGLIKLQDTYKSDYNTSHIIKYYHNLLIMKDVHEDEQYNEYKKIINEGGLRDTLLNLWTNDELDIAINIIKEIDKKGQNKNTYIKSLSNIISDKSILLNNIINKIR